ncbi:MAG: transketolase family protein, partial [Spirochaetes bacterium]|nr:transketolase family protein [Spirochaetota bacterium]
VVPQIFDERYQFDPFKAVRLREGKDVTIATTGYMTQFCIKAALELSKKGISAEVIHFPSIKPLDVESIVASAKKTGSVITVENQSIIGGLGGAICEVLSEKFPVPVKRLGVPDKFGEVATEEYLFNKHGFGVPHIIDAALTLARKNGIQE